MSRRGMILAPATCRCGRSWHAVRLSPGAFPVFLCGICWLREYVLPDVQP